MSTAIGKRRRRTRSSVIASTHTTVRHEDPPMTVDLCSLPEELPSCIDLTNDESDDVVVDLTSSNDTSVVCLGTVTSVPSLPSTTRRRGRKRPTVIVGSGIVPPPTSQSDTESLPDLASTSSDHTLSLDEQDASQQKKVNVCCPICFDSVKVIQETKRQLTSTICGHIFCSTCIYEAIRAAHACPKCRKKLTQKQYHPIFI